MSQGFSGFVIGAPRSGAGKTMVSLGLMRALARRGMRVAPFKCGPDYIDTQFHTCACGGRASVNLDLYMASRAHVADIFARYSDGCDVAVAEGAMGLFDGYSGMEGSAADIARTLGLSVILVVDASSTAFSAAATIYGFRNFCPDVNVAGVIFNRAASPRHRAMLADAAKAAGVECLGFVGRRQGLQTPSRHLGLTLTAREEMERFVAEAAEAVTEGVDMDRLMEMTRIERLPVKAIVETEAPRLTVAVARDEAFSFIYPSNLDSMRRHGARIEFFSPLRSGALPEGTDMIYLPGGYPELYARELEANSAIREAIRDFGEKGGKILAECGGLIYLGRSIDGAAMCGLLPTVATMEGAKLTLGYRSVRVGGMTLRGHEFHYSHVVNPDILPSVSAQTDARGQDVATPIYRHKDTFAGYTHLYWGETDIFDLWK